MITITKKQGAVWVTPSVSMSPAGNICYKIFKERVEILQRQLDNTEAPQDTYTIEGLTHGQLVDLRAVLEYFAAKGYGKYGWGRHLDEISNAITAEINTR